MKDQLVPWRKRSMRQGSEWEEHPFDLLHREVNDLFETYFRGSTRFGRSLAAATGIELSETDDEIRVKAELPGMDEKDIQLSLEEGMLSIRCERREEKEKKKRNYHLSEMSYGSYSRSIALPAKVDGEKADAKFKRGVLTLTLPKTEGAKAERKRIPVSMD
jgi:HSP20 family protein